MCAVTSIVDRSVRSIESIDGRYGGCWRRSSPKPPSHKPRRRLNSSSTPGPVDCARAVWRETLSWVPFGAAPPQVTRLSPPTIPSKPPRSSSPGTTMLGQSPLTRAGCGGGGARSLDRARGVWRLRRWRWRAVTSHVTRVTRAARHARVRVLRHRASRASSTFPFPPCTTGTRALLRRRRSLARSRARRRRRWGWGWRSVTPRVTRVTRARVHVITAHRARHHRPPSPMSPMRTRGSGGGAVSFARLLARAEAEADGHSHVVRVSRVTRARARVILVTALVSATPIEVRSFRRRLVFSSLFSLVFSLVFSFFVSPRAHYDETTGDM